MQNAGQSNGSEEEAAADEHVPMDADPVNGHEPIDVDPTDTPMEADAENPQILDHRKEKQTLYLHTKSMIIDNQTDLTEVFKKHVVDVILRKIEEAIMQGSGFRLSAINELVVQVNRYEPIRGSS